MTAWQQQLLHNGKIRKLLFRKKYILLIHFVYIFFHEIVLENTVCVANSSCVPHYWMGELRLLTKIFLVVEVAFHCEYNSAHGKSFRKYGNFILLSPKWRYTSGHKMTSLFIASMLTLVWQDNCPKQWDLTWQPRSGLATVERLILPSGKVITFSLHRVWHLPYDQMYLHEYALKNT